MLLTINSLLANISIFQDGINKVGDGKMIEKSNSKECGIESLTPRATLAFTKLKHAFNIALILYHGDLECYIPIKINVSGYANIGILC